MALPKSLTSGRSCHFLDFVLLFTIHILKTFVFCFGILSGIVLSGYGLLGLRETEIQNLTFIKKHISVSFPSRGLLKNWPSDKLSALKDFCCIADISI